MCQAQTRVFSGMRSLLKHLDYILARNTLFRIQLYSHLNQNAGNSPPNTLGDRRFDQ
ncbi:MAG: hypothetical protein KME23_25490 [Goleter apudmare HA4340-LM2]|nr:hypothetical protein [Goleter apudmare HA4340-LM2]